MFNGLKRFLVGMPLSNEQLAHERLPKRTALAVFSSDALSSTAYATEAILIALSLAGPIALGVATPISVAIATLLIIVAFSYRQTIMAYPQGGGTYIVARENLGTLPSLTAAAALLIDYTLTVAVSTSAGVAAITSAWHWLEPWRVELAVGVIVLLTLANLRGVKESGSIFAVPTYAFVASMFVLIGMGMWKLVSGQVVPTAAPEITHFPKVLEPLGLFLVLRAFAAGCTALTGIEAIADGVPAFKKPESHNAAVTLVMMVVLCCTIFIGTTVLASVYHIIPDGASEPETAISQLARSIFGAETPLYFVLQIATMLILILASNTAFADFPRLAYFLANDRFLPGQFSHRGDRLGFSNGIIALGFMACMLVITFGAREQTLLPLYAVGVFISFTVSQIGMVRRWYRLQTEGWHMNAFINGLGASVTGLVLIVIAGTKFMEGAWTVVMLIPIMVIILLSIHRHYASVAEQLSLSAITRPQAVRRHTAIVLVSGVHRGVIPALQYALSLAPDNVTAAYVNLDDKATERVKQKWEQWGLGIPLTVLPSPYRSLIQPLLQYIEEMDNRYDDDVLTVIIPEFVPSKWWQYALHNQTALQLKAALFFNRSTSVLSIPYHLDR